MNHVDQFGIGPGDVSLHQRFVVKGERGAGRPHVVGEVEGVEHHWNPQQGRIKHHRGVVGDHAVDTTDEFVDLRLVGYEFHPVQQAGKHHLVVEVRLDEEPRVGIGQRRLQRLQIRQRLGQIEAWRHPPRGCIQQHGRVVVSAPVRALDCNGGAVGDGHGHAGRAADHHVAGTSAERTLHGLGHLG